jgi:hypothetical protein
MKPAENESLGQAPWALIEPHAMRDAVIVVSPALDLKETADVVARNDHARVAAWIESGSLAKPTAAQLESWRSTPERIFASVVVQPYVLVQEILSS